MFVLVYTFFHMIQRKVSFYSSITPWQDLFLLPGVFHRLFLPKLCFHRPTKHTQTAHKEDDDDDDALHSCLLLLLAYKSFWISPCHKILVLKPWFSGFALGVFLRYSYFACEYSENQSGKIAVVNRVESSLLLLWHTHCFYWEHEFCFTFMIKVKMETTK